MSSLNKEDLNKRRVREHGAIVTYCFMQTLIRFKLAPEQYYENDDVWDFVDVRFNKLYYRVLHEIE